jgi:hypothetical protein
VQPAARSSASKRRSPRTCDDTGWPVRAAVRQRMRGKHSVADTLSQSHGTRSRRVREICVRRWFYREDHRSSIGLTRAWRLGRRTRRCHAAMFTAADDLVVGEDVASRRLPIHWRGPPRRRYKRSAFALMEPCSASAVSTSRLGLNTNNGNEFLNQVSAQGSVSHVIQDTTQDTTQDTAPITGGQVPRHTSSTDVCQSGSAGDGPRACWHDRRARRRVMATAPIHRKRAQVGWDFWLRWVLATSLGWAVGGVLLSAFIGGLGDELGNVVGATVLGLMVGIGRWLVLRQWLDEAGWWILASARGFLLIGERAAAFLLTASHSCPKRGDERHHHAAHGDRVRRVSRRKCQIFI